MIETEVPTMSVRGVSWGLRVSLVRVEVRLTFTLHLNLWTTLPTVLFTLFTAVGQCQLKGNVTHLNICFNQMEERKEIHLLPSHQVVHFQLKIKGWRKVYKFRAGSSLPLLPVFTWLVMFHERWWRV